MTITIDKIVKTTMRPSDADFFGPDFLDVGKNHYPVANDKNGKIPPSDIPTTFGGYDDQSDLGKFMNGAESRRVMPEGVVLGDFDAYDIVPLTPELRQFTNLYFTD